MTSNGVAAAADARNVQIGTLLGRRGTHDRRNNRATTTVKASIIFPFNLDVLSFPQSSSRPTVQWSARQHVYAYRCIYVDSIMLYGVGWPAGRTSK